MIAAGDRSEAATLGGPSGRVQNASGDPTGRTPGNKADGHRALSPNARSLAQASPPRHSVPKGHGDRENPSPTRTKAIKSPPNPSPQKSHFSRR
jgi:hypothetical protein